MYGREFHEWRERSKLANAVAEFCEREAADLMRRAVRARLTAQSLRLGDDEQVAVYQCSGCGRRLFPK